MKKSRWCSVVIAAGIGAGVVLTTGAGLYAAGVMVNTTPSIPVGVYLMRNAPTIRRGDLVAACVPEGPSLAQAYERGYLGSGTCAGGVEPVLKPVVAVAGDVVDVTDGGVSVDGVQIEGSSRSQHDSKGRPLAAIPLGMRQVASGEVWLISTHHPMSFDSRYWGGVPVGAVRGGLTPFWVVR